MIWAGWLLILTGLFFFLFGTVALLRFPDLFTRLHALTKADNLGLGMICTGVAIQAGSWILAFKLLIIWVLVLFASASVSQLISQKARLVDNAKKEPES